MVVEGKGYVARCIGEPEVGGGKTYPDTVQVSLIVILVGSSRLLIDESQRKTRWVTGERQDQA
jgi:hypothetical protein